MSEESNAGRAENEASDPDVDEYYPWLKLHKKQYIIIFSLEGDSPQKRELTAKIVSLDHKAKRRLSPPSSAWDEVNKLLLNVIVSAHEGRYAEANALLKDTESLYRRHNQSINRKRYLAGFAGGTAAAIILGYLVILFLSTAEPTLQTKLLASIFLFAGMGSIVSVLTRLKTVEIQDETGQFDMIISGAARPVVAIIFSLIVYIILSLKAVKINFGDTEANPNFIFFLAAFLCGFTERFANDIVARLPFARLPRSDGAPED
jgi:hypothetical protein